MLELAGHYFVFTGLNELRFKEVIAECQKQNWVPLLILRPKDPAQPILVPGFPARDAALRFAKRNLPPGNLFGVVEFPPDELARLLAEWRDGRQWRFESWPYPKVITQTHTPDVDVFELRDAPDVFRAGTKTQARKLLSPAP
jgi:hypothetical protein